MKTWLLLLLLLPFKAKAQDGFVITDQDKVTIPFQFINNIIIIPVVINGVELQFVLDSGMGETLLFSLENKEINFNNVEKISFNGLGGEASVEGLQSSKNTVSIAGNFVDTNHKIYIVSNEDFNISTHLGVPVNGIMGYEFFKNYPVEINYIQHRMYIYPDLEKIKNIGKYESLPITLEKKKPYTEATLHIKGKDIPAKMLLDLGNSDAVWIFPKTIEGLGYQGAQFEDYLGRGFNGDVRGRRGRIHSVTLGKYTLDKPIVAFPDQKSLQSISFIKNRGGSIGTEIISRFNVIMDYPGNRFYFKKNKYFNYPFKYNMSGLDIKHDGVQWAQTLVKMEVEGTRNAREALGRKGTEVFKSPGQFQYKFELKPAYTIAGVRKGSPGDIAGLQEGDQVISVKNIPTSELTLEHIVQILSLKEDKVINIEVKRDSVLLKKQVVLKDPIPYQED
jgi:hypothetical protein